MGWVPGRFVRDWYLDDGSIKDRQRWEYLFILSALIGNVGMGVSTGDGYLGWVHGRFGEIGTYRWWQRISKCGRYLFMFWCWIIGNVGLGSNSSDV